MLSFFFAFVLIVLLVIVFLMKSVEPTLVLKARR